MKLTGLSTIVTSIVLLITVLLITIPTFAEPIILPVVPQQIDSNESGVILVRSEYTNTNEIGLLFQNWSQTYKFLVIDITAYMVEVENSGLLFDTNNLEPYRPRQINISNLDSEQPAYLRIGIQPLSTQTYYFDFSPFLMEFRNRNHQPILDEDGNIMIRERIEHYHINWAAHDKDYERALELAEEHNWSQPQIANVYNEYIQLFYTWRLNHPNSPDYDFIYPTFDLFVREKIMAQQAENGDDRDSDSNSEDSNTSSENQSSTTPTRRPTLAGD